MLIFIQARSIGQNGCHAKQVKSRENSYKDLIENEFKEKRHNYIITEGKKECQTHLSRPHKVSDHASS